MAEEKHFSEAMVLEMLIRKKAIEMGIIGPSVLVSHQRRPSVGDSAHEDFTLRIFERIASTPDALRLWEQAVTPLPEQQADKRKQSVNQRLGRFL